MAYKIKQSGDYRKRRNYSMIKNSLELDNLLQIQKDSYQWFVTDGIKEVFEDLFPIESFSGSLSLEFGEYEFDTPRYSIKECKDRQITYSAPLKVQTRLFNNETGEVKEQEIFLGDMPLMTESGTFIINGAERVIVSQLVRSPSVYYSKEIDKNGKPVFSTKVIPTRGTWLEYEMDGEFRYLSGYLAKQAREHQLLLDYKKMLREYAELDQCIAFSRYIQTKEDFDGFFQEFYHAIGGVISVAIEEGGLRNRFVKDNQPEASEDFEILLATLCEMLTTELLSQVILDLIHEDLLKVECVFEDDDE